MSDNNDLSPMLRVREVASLLGIHANTIRRWSDEGKLKAFQITSRVDRRFRREDVARFLFKMNSTVTNNPR